MIGQRVSDLLTLKEEQIRFQDNNIALLNITQFKTKTPVTVPVDNHYVITILKNSFPHNISSQNFNKYIKEVFKRAGISQIIQGYRFNPTTKRKEKMEGPKYEFITSHDLRRSFATYHYDNGKPVGVIMKITGHKRESTFYDYIGKNPNKDYDAYNFLNT
jgi:integrase